ncbi:MAG: nucleotidyl transferase AbiEii/AbiGii toxin family protein [Phycisphaerales bacterium]|nr:nucleotidyl transferase AbiEii/AbiGii toxin family protein [Phycisphaerales bacterium]
MPKPDALAQSIKQRLMNLSQRQNEQFNAVLVRFAVERLLYRLTRSPHATQFVLKGAMLFAVWSAQPHRPTQDVDLLGFGPPETDRLVKLFREVCTANVEPDGLLFDPDSVTAEPIREDAVYDGLRVRLLARLGTARVPMQVDIGFGDVVSPEPRELTLGPMLDLPAPRLRTYPPETVIAEKFEAMLALGMANSRMKDYYDLWMLSRTMRFELGTLRTAVRATAERRKTLLPADLPVGLSDRFADDASKQTQWSAFVRRLGGSHAAPPLGEVVRGLAEFLRPVLQSGDTAARHWPPGGPWQTNV